jgi:hypothetical protein
MTDANDADGSSFLDWFKETDADGDNRLVTIAVRLGVAVLVGAWIAWVHRKAMRRGRGEADPLTTTVVLLTVLVAMTAKVIDKNLARAFTLGGALTIIRFRTLIQDARDTSFVIFAVVAGMTIGIGNWPVCVIGVPLVSIVVLAMARGLGGGAATPIGERLLVRLGLGRDATTLFDATFKKHLVSSRLTRTTTARAGAAIELVYEVRRRAEADSVALVRELNELEGVQHVELGEE